MLTDPRSARHSDPTCSSFSHCLLNYKGFLACQAHRISHLLWSRRRRPLALHSRVADVFSIDIHPATRLDSSIIFDHATSVVVGETVVVGNNNVGNKSSNREQALSSAFERRYWCPRGLLVLPQSTWTSKSNSAFSEGAICYAPVHVDPRGLPKPIAPLEKALLVLPLSTWRHVDTFGGCADSAFSKGAICAPHFRLPEIDAENILCIGFGRRRGRARWRETTEGGRRRAGWVNDVVVECTDAAEKEERRLWGHRSEEQRRVVCGVSEAAKEGASTMKEGASANGGRSNEEVKQKCGGGGSPGGGMRRANVLVVLVGSLVIRSAKPSLATQ
ncbi:hypothetical protein Scep_019974 [Stephania cephalantha]|uniref:Serine acetyltransferase N-terminal domain-containing protein n=1 Tax=Stephania cephalantha TaxID=152367 RepID=A0AAP0IC75_9MAGN